MEIRCPCCDKVFEMGTEISEHIRSQVRTKEFEKEVESRISSELARISAQTEQTIERIRHESDMESAKYKNRLSEERMTLTAEIEKLNNQIALKDANMDSAVREAQAQAQLSSMERIGRLEADLAAKSREVEYYKDLKTRMSTKMVGETLEKHCENQFNQIRMAAFPKAEFHKDNEVSAASGSKGDYVYREQDGDVELLSIMFEMKNDMDTTATRKRNEQFLKELDKDRREKGCEYAVLVTLLEPDSELYNQGIVDMSWQYPKMYVVRPQFFIPIITLLRNASLGALDAKKQLMEMKKQDLELTEFRNAFEEYKGSFHYNLDQATSRQVEAVGEIEKAIRRLEAAKAAILAGGKQLGTMSKKIDGMTVEGLCKNSPSVYARMDEQEGEEE